MTDKIDLLKARLQVLFTLEPFKSDPVAEQLIKEIMHEYDKKIKKIKKEVKKDE